jgi:aminopeptidase
VDYAAQGARIKTLQGTLDRGNVVRVLGPGTDLTLGIKGRLARGAESGRHNIPDGECFLGPVEDQTEGVITFELPQCYDGKTVEGIRLEFSKGKIVKASAKKNQAHLLALLDDFPGNRRLGELGIGMNDCITQYMRDILFDEKIMGTAHFALGRSYDYVRGGGKNRGTIHWDLVKDLRSKGTRILVDDKAILADGKMLV